MNITSEQALAILNSEKRLILDGDTGMLVSISGGFDGRDQLSYYDPAGEAEGEGHDVIVVTGEELETCQWSLSENGQWITARNWATATNDDGTIWEGRVFITPSNLNEVLSL